MVKVISRVLVCFGTFIINYYMLMAYGLSWQWMLSIFAILWIGLGVYMGENDHD